MRSITDPELDTQIRQALNDANAKGKLDVVAAVTGIAGGEAELRRIMDSDEELSFMDRSMLGLHLT